MTRAQAAGLQQVNGAVGEMDMATQQDAAMVEQSNAAARRLAAEAEELAGQVGRFRLARGGAQPTTGRRTGRYSRGMNVAA